MRNLVMPCALSLLILFGTTGITAAAPAITGTPIIDSPQLLDWGRDTDNGLPDLTEPTANRLYDLHGSFSDCDIALSTSGNYHMALRDLWYDLYLPTYGSSLGLRNWFYTTSPPISTEQVKNSNVVFGNLALKCMPQVAVGPLKVINSLKAAGVTEGGEIPIFRNRGNVLLVKKGNPKHIQTIWDLGRPDVKLVTPNPVLEPGSFGNYSGSIFNIALNDESNRPYGWTAERLFNAIFNEEGSPGSNVGARHRGQHKKWLSGTRIHHREVPWSVAYGHADVGLLFYHLALNAVRSFPDKFEIVPLGGSVDNPQPLPGNQIGVLYAIRIKGSWTDKQLQAREALLTTFSLPEFTQILERHGLQK